MIRPIDLHDDGAIALAKRELESVGLSSFIGKGLSDHNWKAIVFPTAIHQALLRSTEAWTLLMGQDAARALRARLERTPQTFQFTGNKVVAKTTEGLRDLADLIRSFPVTSEVHPHHFVG